MTPSLLSKKAETYVRRLCLDIPNRRVGSTGNRAATNWFAGMVASSGFETESPGFDCIDWTHTDAMLCVNGQAFEALVSPYSLGCHVHARLAVVSTLAELEAAKVAGQVLLVRGELAKEQLMPKNFDFYNPDEHKRIIRLLETRNPQAIVAATSRDPEMAGAVYPFPLIEDGDFDVPSVYMTEEEGHRLAEQVGTEVALDIRASRTPARGCNVIARKGANPRRRVVLFAHIDAKEGTPGAIDNATGVATLLLLAELLADYAGSSSIEIVALNGEDHYSAAGEKLWVSSNTARFEEIILGINLDGAGYYEGKTAYSLYDCPPELAGSIRGVLARHAEMVEGESWYQSDHSLFLQHQRPALAITSERFSELWTHVAHTPRDRPDIVDPTKLVRIATALRDVLLRVQERPAPKWASASGIA